MSALILALTTFLATHMDNFLLYLLLFAGVRHPRTARAMGAGIFAGTFTLLLGSYLLAELLLAVTDSAYLGLLGLVPLLLGLHHLLRPVRAASPREQPLADGAGFLMLFSLTLTSGGDNLAVYIPLFTRFRGMSALLIFLSYAVLTGIMVHLCRRFSRLDAVGSAVDRWGHILVPLVLVALGLYILWDSGLFGLF